jgi:hypothetical protein
MNDKSDKALRKELLDYLDNSHTHISLQDAAKDFPEEFMNVKPDGVPYSFWELLEHIRFSQYDMIDFIRNPDYKEMRWPDDYWPEKGKTASKKMWDESLKKFEDDMKVLSDLIKDSSTDLLAPIPHGSGQTVLREVLQIIDHNSYHIGEFILMRKAANLWKR